MAESIAILVPRLDLPFKNFKSFDPEKHSLPPNVVEVRNYWQNFFESLKITLDDLHFNYKIYNIPMWEITSEYVESLEEKVVLIPHKTNKQILSANKKVLYAMQIMTRWLFSIDPAGWGASASVYPCKEYVTASENASTFEYYRDLLVRKKSSKYDQPNQQSRLKLILKREIPVGKFLFFPCQIPHDESIRFHSDIEELDLIESIIEWADSRRVRVVFKKHPANLKSMAPFEKLVSNSKFCNWSDANIHDLIRLSEGVLTINSGVGFEALLHKKPVVTFGKTEYDVITYKSDMKDLDRAYEYIKAFKFKVSKSLYYKFFEWYCTDYCIDLSKPLNFQKMQLEKTMKKHLVF